MRVTKNKHPRSQNVFIRSSEFNFKQREENWKYYYTRITPVKNYHQIESLENNHKERRQLHDPKKQKVIILIPNQFPRPYFTNHVDPLGHKLKLKPKQKPSMENFFLV